MSSLQRIDELLSGVQTSIHGVRTQTISALALEPRAFYALSGLLVPTVMNRLTSAASLVQDVRSLVIESYSSGDRDGIRSKVTSLQGAVSDIADLVNRLNVHAEQEPPASQEVSDDDTLYGPNRVYSTAQGAVRETSIQMPIGGGEVAILLGGTSVTLPPLTATAVIDKRYPVTMHVNLLTVTGDKNIEVDTSKIGSDDLRNPERYGVSVEEDAETYTLSFPREISCVEIIRSKGLLSQKTSMTRAYRTAASVSSALSGKIQRLKESAELVITEEYVEDAPYPLFYIISGADTYTVEDGNILLIKGRTPASSLSSGTYTLVRESLSYRGEALVQGADVTYTFADAYVPDTRLYAGDVLVNDKGQTAYVASEGSVSRDIGIGRLVYATQSRLLRSLASVSDSPSAVDVNTQIDNSKLSEVYDYATASEVYIESVRRCCLELASMPVEYPIVTEIIRHHKKRGYDRAADLLSDLMLSDYMDVTESESSYESMLAEHTKTMQVKVLT